MVEEFKKILDSDEQVLWSLHHIRNFAQENLVGTICSFSGATGIIIFAFFAFSDLLLFAIIFSILISILFLSLIILINYEYRKSNRLFNLDKQEKREYLNIFLLTNKRWIQKDLLIDSYRYIERFSNEITKKEKDVLIVALPLIKIWYIIDTISLFVDIDDFNNNHSTLLGAEVPDKHKRELINALSNLPQYNKKYTDRGEIIFYRKELEDQINFEF